MSNTRDTPINSHPNYKAIDPDQTLEVIVRILSYLVESNEGIEIPPALVTSYGFFASPWTYEWASVREYIERLLEWIVCGPECFIAAFCVMTRLEEIGTIPLINQRTIHRVYLTCLMLAVKFVEDETLSNPDFAKVGCVTTAELNAMELSAYQALNFTCSISPEDYEDMTKDIAAIDAVLKRRQIRRTTSKKDPVTFTALCTAHGPSAKYRWKLSRKSVGSVEEAVARPKHKSLTRRSANYLLKRLSGSHKQLDIAAPEPVVVAEAPLVFNPEVPKLRKNGSRFGFAGKQVAQPTTTTTAAVTKHHAGAIHHDRNAARAQPVAFFQK